MLCDDHKEKERKINISRFDKRARKALKNAYT